MIKVSERKVEIQGGTFIVLNDFINVVMALRKMLTQSFGGDVADRMITDMGRIAYTDESEHQKIVDKLIEYIEENEGSDE